MLMLPFNAGLGFQSTAKTDQDIPEVHSLSMRERGVVRGPSLHFRLPSNLLQHQNLLSQPSASICFPCTVIEEQQLAAVLGGSPGLSKAWCLESVVLGRH